jgi:Na+-driven multidrug efflux pump
MIPMGLVMAVAPRACVTWMSGGDPAVAAGAAQYVALASWALVPLAFEVVLEAVAGGTGDTLPAMGIEVVGTLLRIPIAWGLARAGLGFESVCWAVALTVLIKGAVFELWFRRAWRERAA